MRNRLAVALLGVLCATRIVGCYGPTQYTLVLTTDVKCTDYRGVSITTGRLHDIEKGSPAATDTLCDAQGNLGTLVVVPSGARDDSLAVKVIVGLGRDPAKCTAPDYGKGCIVARRSLRFIPHESLSVPIELQAICDGIPCLETATCAAGRCVDLDDPSKSVPGGAADAGDAGDAGDITLPTPCGDTTGLEMGSPWPMSGGCPTHAGRSIAIGPRKANVKWMTDLGGFLPLSSGPAVAADATIYAPSSSGGLNAYQKDGRFETAWNVAGNSNNATPAIGRDGTIYQGSAGANGLYAIRPHTFCFGCDTAFGMASAPVYYSPTIGSDGTIYVPGFRLVALSPDGATKWIYPPVQSAQLSLLTAPAIGSSRVIYFNASDGALYAVKPDGTLAWKRLTDVAPTTSPSIGKDGTIYIGANTKVYAVNPDGTTKWTSPTGGVVDAMPAIASNGTIVVGAADGVLYAFRPDDGKLLWKTAASVGDPSSSTTGGASAVIDGTGAVFVGTGPGKFSAFSADGKLLWEFASTSCPTCRFGSAAIGSDGTIYAPADKLYAFAP